MKLTLVEPSRETGRDLRERSSIIRIETHSGLTDIRNIRQLKRKIQYNKDWNSIDELRQIDKIILKRKIQYNKDWNKSMSELEMGAFDLRERSSIIRIETLRGFECDPGCHNLRERSSIIRIETSDKINPRKCNWRT